MPLNLATASRLSRDHGPRQGRALLGVSSLTAGALVAPAFSSASLPSARQDVGRDAHRVPAYRLLPTGAC